MAIAPVMINGRVLRPHKALVSPSFGSPSVLTREPWAFVRLSLKRDENEEALFYWDQAKAFHDAASGLPMESAPLLLYYSFMNAAKALLVAKEVTLNPYHGVREWRTKIRSSDWLKRIGVQFKSEGVLPSLATYLGDAEETRSHSLKELFFNMPFIHRTYCLTYPGQRDMFAPIRSCAFVRDSKSGLAYFAAEFTRDYAQRGVMTRLPDSFMADPTAGARSIRSTASVAVSSSRRPSETDLNAISELHRRLRADLFYINGTQTLWYIKLTTPGPARLSRHNPTLVLSAMHRLSELCRYNPMDFRGYLAGPMNWLLHEFMGMSSNQYVDEIASELTGHQFLIPNVRAAA